MSSANPTTASTADVLAAQAIVAMFQGTRVSADPDVAQLAALDPWEQPADEDNATAVA